MFQTDVLVAGTEGNKFLHVIEVLLALCTLIELYIAWDDRKHPFVRANVTLLKDIKLAGLDREWRGLHLEDVLTLWLFANVRILILHLHPIDAFYQNAS